MTPPRIAIRREPPWEPPWGIEPQTYALREPLPSMTLALTRHFGCAVGTERRLWPPQTTAVRTTNGATQSHPRAPGSLSRLEGAETRTCKPRTRSAIVPANSGIPRRQELRRRPR
jgi:hypothetical protein